MPKTLLKQLRLGLSIIGLMAGFSSVATAQTAPNEPLIIKDITIIPMTGARQKIKHATVEIRDGRIVRVSTRPSTRLCPRRSTCIDGRGKWLIPGLTDAHVHLENDLLLQLYMRLPTKPTGAVATQDMGLPFVAHGITQVFNLSAMDETFTQKADIAASRAIGPRIISAYMLDGAEPILPEGMSHGVANPAAGRQAVRNAFNAGYDLIKVYSLLDLETFLAIVDEARKHKMPVIGHIPSREKGITSKFFVPGFNAVAHAEEFAMQTSVPDEAQIPAYVAMAKNNGTALVTTLTLDDNILTQTENPESLKTRADIEFINPMLQAIVKHHNPYVAQASKERIEWLRKIVNFNRKLVKAFSDAGIAILAGSDSQVPGVVPGFALVDELDALTQAGLTPYQALYSATRAPCDWLGPKSKCGTIAVGQRADLVILDADPTQDISNIRALSSVIIGGKTHSKAELEAKMQAMKARFGEATKAGN